VVALLDLAAVGLAAGGLREQLPAEAEPEHGAAERQRLGDRRAGAVHRRHVVDGVAQARQDHQAVVVGDEWQRVRGHPHVEFGAGRHERVADPTGPLVDVVLDDQDPHRVRGLRHGCCIATRAGGGSQNPP
jgi:hypothetical protein